MPRKTECPVCQSTTWRKEPSSGLLACSEGHILQVGSWRHKHTASRNYLIRHLRDCRLTWMKVRTMTSEWHRERCVGMSSRSVRRRRGKHAQMSGVGSGPSASSVHDANLCRALRGAGKVLLLSVPAANPPPSDPISGEAVETSRRGV